MGRTSVPRRRMAVLATATRRWSRRGREVLLGKQDLVKSATAPSDAGSMMTENFATMPAVWVLIFDRYPLDMASRESRELHCTGGPTPAARLRNEGAFDRLDLESTCFEQFLLQDVRSNISADEVFGGEAAFRKLAEVMIAADQTATLVSLTVEGASITEHEDCSAMESSLRRCGVPLHSVIGLDVSNCDAAVSDGKGSDRALLANLVWMEARLASAENAAKTILDSVFTRLQSHSEQPGHCPVLMVTFRTGDDRDVRGPLKSGIAENRIHVPLWIQPHVGHACRVQALAGSFDLLPTIETFLGSALASDEASPPDVAQIADSSERVVASGKQLASSPGSLAFLCGAPQVCPDRLLPLNGDGWKGARTEEFLLVIPDRRHSHTEKTESDGDDSEEPSRRLFVKPEDRYNVNDVSGTYATAADELARLIS